MTWIEERAEAERVRALGTPRQPSHSIAMTYTGEQWSVTRLLPDGVEHLVWQTPDYLPALRAAREVAAAEQAQALVPHWDDQAAEHYWSSGASARGQAR